MGDIWPRRRAQRGGLPAGDEGGAIEAQLDLADAAGQQLDDHPHDAAPEVLVDLVAGGRFRFCCRRRGRPASAVPPPFPRWARESTDGATGRVWFSGLFQEPPDAERANEEPDETEEDHSHIKDHDACDKDHYRHQSDEDAINDQRYAWSWAPGWPRTGPSGVGRVARFASDDRGSASNPVGRAAGFHDGEGRESREPLDHVALHADVVVGESEGGRQTSPMPVLRAVAGLGRVKSAMPRLALRSRLPISGQLHQR